MNTLISSIKQQYLFDKAQLIADYRQQHRVRDFFVRHHHILTTLLAHLWQATLADEAMCLLAIGGFGRQEVYPHSDLDIGIVAFAPLNEKQHEKTAQLIQSLWDMGLQPAARIGSIEELCLAAREDLSADTALMEAQFICGRHILSDTLKKRLFLQRDLAHFIEGKILEHNHRHAKAQGSGSLLEPNIKTSSGGLRDIHTLLWISKAQGLSTDFSILVEQDILTPAEARLLLISHHTLARIRIDLHLIAQRAEERLLFDFQKQVAEEQGLSDSEDAQKSEKLMRRFYRASKLVKQLDGILLPMLRERVYATLPRHVYPLDTHYYQVGNLIAAKNPHCFEEDTHHIFHIIQLIQENKDIIGIAPRTLRAWWAAARHIDTTFHDDPQNRQYFIGFFRQPEKLTRILRFLNLYGVLGKYLPNFGRIVGLLQHDLFHIYPVDDHILTAVRNMRRLAIDDFAHEHPFASSLMHNFDDKPILYLAALFHDIAKGRSGDHAILGIEDAHQFAQEHHLNHSETTLLCWLVEHHLLLSQVAQKEDLHNPQVIERFCETVDTPHKLIALYLLTVCDIRATNPALWTHWKAGLFQHLFQAALAYLQGKSKDPSVLVGRRRQWAKDSLCAQQIDEKAQNRLWKMLGDAYFVRHDSEEICRHLGIIASQPEEAACAVWQINDTLEIMAYMPNRARLFAGLCQIFSNLSLNILRARAYVTEHDFILDSFILIFPTAFSEADKTRISEKLTHKLNDFIHGKSEPINEPAQPKSRRSRHLPIVPKISIDSEEGLRDYFTLQLVTHNRNGLLANIARLFSDLNIRIRYAGINTLGDRVEDSFLIYAPELQQTDKQLQLKNRLRDILED